MATTTTKAELVSVPDAAVLSGLHERTIRRRAPGIPGAQFVGGMWLLPRRAVRTLQRKPRAKRCRGRRHAATSSSGSRSRSSSTSSPRTNEVR